jgi:hypothetical protein
LAVGIQRHAPTRGTFLLNIFFSAEENTKEGISIFLKGGPEAVFESRSPQI